VWGGFPPSLPPFLVSIFLFVLISSSFVALALVSVSVSGYSGLACAFRDLLARHDATRSRVEWTGTLPIEGVSLVVSS
jgi:hypothetical protein